MTQKKAFAAICPRCEGTGRHQRGRCFQCGGNQIIGLKSSTSMRTFQHHVTVDGIRKRFVTWGRDLSEATRCAEIFLTKKGLL